MFIVKDCTRNPPHTMESNDAKEEDIDNMIEVLKWAKRGCPRDDPNVMPKGETNA